MIRILGVFYYPFLFSGCGVLVPPLLRSSFVSLLLPLCRLYLLSAGSG